MPDYFATKYDSAAHEVIALLADETEGYGIRDDSTGNVDAPTGWFALVTIPADVDLSAQPRDWFGDPVFDLANEYGVTPTDVIGHHIVTHNSQGFVSVETFATREEADNEYRCRAARFDIWSDEDRNSEDDVYVCPVTGHGYHSL